MNKENVEVIILLGVEEDIDEIELLYNEINDFLAKGVNYPGWKKGVYPIREDAIKGISEGNLYIAKYHDEIVGTVILNNEPEGAYYNVKWKIYDNYNEMLI